MNTYKLWSPFFIVMIFALLPGSCIKKNLRRKEDIAIKREKEGVSFFYPFDLYKNTKRKRALQGNETDTEMECPQRSGNRSPGEFAKCPKTFCQHISYKCNMQCREQDTGDVDCALYNFTGTHHCSSAKGLTIPIEEVCDNIDQCPRSDDESTCVMPCWPSCMCIGLMVTYRDTNVDISGFIFNGMYIVTNHTDPKSVGVSHLSYLSYMVNTGIHTLPDSFIRGFHNLKSLDLSNNKIAFLTDDNFRDVSSLVSLDLSFNMINHLSNNVFRGLFHLNYLDMRYNQIQYLPDNVFSGLSRLTNLDLSHNQIQYLPDSVFNGLSGLFNLNLFTNQIAVLPENVFYKVPALTQLNLRQNRIAILPDSVFHKIPALVYLHLFQNQIEILPDNVFHNLSALAYLYLGRNKIAVLPDDVINGLSSLSLLDLSRNQIRDLPDNFCGLSQLSELDLSHNQITLLPDNVLCNISTLFDLNLEQNQIAVLPDYVFDKLPFLFSLNLGRNQIAFVPDNLLSGLPALKTLNLHGNKITSLRNDVFNGLPALRELYLEQNQIVALPNDVFSRLPSLFALLLNGNRLSSLPFLPVSLEVLDISYNSFTNLNYEPFINNSKMTLLSVVGNDLEVRKYMFEGLNNLNTLLTDTPFMCCVRPKSVSKERCIKTTVSDLTLLDYCFSKHASCKSEVDAISSCEALIGSAVQRVCLWIIGICALVGNMIVFFYRLFIERGNITQSYSLFVLNLCISDFLMGVYLLIIGVADVYYNGVYAWNERKWRESIVCTTAGILSTISSEMSTFLILLVTIDRVIVIAFPMSRISRWSISWKQAIIISLCLWVVSISLAIIPIIPPMQSYFQGEYYSQSGVCLALPLTGDKRPGAEYSFSLFVCLNCIIFIAIVIGQICIIKSIITSGSRLTSSQTRQRDMSVARTLFMVVATDFCCWFPIGVMGVLAKTGYNIPDDAYAWIMIFVLPVNAAINPFLYTATAIWRKRQREKRRVEMTSTKQSHHHQADSIETSIQ